MLKKNVPTTNAPRPAYELPSDRKESIMRLISEFEHADNNGIIGAMVKFLCVALSGSLLFFLIIPKSFHTVHDLPWNGLHATTALYSPTIVLERASIYVLGYATSWSEYRSLLVWTDRRSCKYYYNNIKKMVPISRYLASEDIPTIFFLLYNEIKTKRT